MQQPRSPAVILGGGVTGLAAGLASGLPVYEAQASPGGICSSYYLRRGSAERLTTAPADGEAWRFEHGGGHWIFGGHAHVLDLIEQLAPCDRFVRRSSVYFPEQRRYVRYPLQHHLFELEPDTADRALAEMRDAPATEPATMADWLAAQFGPTLGALFFTPFHASYTAGLWREIAPQDAYKTPLDMRRVTLGARGPSDAAGYNTTFLYPRGGLDALIAALARRVDLRCGHRVRCIDLARREIHFADRTSLRYRNLLSTLPLNRMLELTGLITAAPVAPHTSVLVLNIGARRGPRCPTDHWLYVPHSRGRFHRIGFYDNVATHFLPASERSGAAATSLYVERSYRDGTVPSEADRAAYAATVVQELQAWQFIGDVDVLDATWVDVAYTWSHPRSTWVSEAIALLAGHGIVMSGRYARWHFQGIADSLRDGLLAGHSLRLAADAA